ncbi:hypothetical protein V8E54_007015 [Elaphomyces granulatus]
MASSMPSGKCSLITWHSSDVRLLLTRTIEDNNNPIGRLPQSTQNLHSIGRPDITYTICLVTGEDGMIRIVHSIAIYTAHISDYDKERIEKEYLKPDREHPRVSVPPPPLTWDAAPGRDCRRRSQYYWQHGKGSRTKTKTRWRRSPAAERAQDSGG